MSSLQKNILIVLVAIDQRLPGPVATRELEKLLAESDNRPVYGPNLRASCRRMEKAGWLRTLRSSSLHLAVELTHLGREMAAPLLNAVRDAENTRQRKAEVRVLPVRNSEERQDVLINIDGVAYTAFLGNFVVRLDGTTCLQLCSTDGSYIELEGDALQVATWYQACHDAGMSTQAQVNAYQIGTRIPK